MDKRKPVIACILLVSIICMFATVACRPIKEGEAVKATIAYIKDPDGLESGYSSQVLIALSMMRHDHGFEYDVLEGGNTAQIKGNVESAINNSSYRLVFATSYIANAELAKRSREVGGTKKISTIGFEASGENIASFTFRNEEISFLVGAMSATISKTGHVAYIGAFDDSSSIPFRVGFAAGAKTVNPRAVVYEEFLQSYVNPAKMSETVAILEKSGCDVVFANCGASVLGVDNEKLSPGLKVVLASGFDFESPKIVARINTDVQSVVSDMIEMFLNDELAADNDYSYGYVNGIFTISVRENMDNAVRTLERYKQVFAEYVPEIPRTEEELEEFDFEYWSTVTVSSD
ncbi:MAG: BMP family ABC transporter substrate-binding protein [Eubacteriaceae bacterium]|nr:BMP family ABC transporter substrate-binding protein [Eubacteriaceae bacterium]